uniref:Uncharacterized protein n=1 Tax=Mesocestoides corti TaxID=53468 RepID=A0A5K3G2B0_MESCO
MAQRIPRCVCTCQCRSHGPRVSHYLWHSSRAQRWTETERRQARCGRVAQWITRLTTDQKIPGSNPGVLACVPLAALLLPSSHQPPLTCWCCAPPPHSRDDIALGRSRSFNPFSLRSHTTYPCVRGDSRSPHPSAFTQHCYVWTLKSRYDCCVPPVSLLVPCNIVQHQSEPRRQPPPPLPPAPSTVVALALA